MNRHPTADYIKRQARNLKKELQVPHHEALDKAAQIAGFSNYAHFLGTSVTEPASPSRRLPSYRRSVATALPAGTLVRMKPFKEDGLVMANPRPVDDGVYCYGHSGPGFLLRQEVSVYRDQTRAGDFWPMRLYMPYGKWTCEDGTEVLHNRDYCPMWAKTPDGKVSKIDPDTWVQHIEEEWFFKDGTPPWDVKESISKCMKVLDEWGVAGKKTRLLEMLPYVLETGNTDILKKTDINKIFPHTKAA